MDSEFDSEESKLQSCITETPPNVLESSVNGVFQSMNGVPEPPIPTKTTNESIDKMTLELLMNKTKYQKYVSKTDPKRFSEIEKYHNRICMYKSQMLEITEVLLNNPQKQITNDVDEAFEYYSKTLIKYFQMKLLEDEETEYSDTLFGEINDNKEFEERKPTMTSFWSKERVLKTDASAFFNKKNLPKTKNNRLL